MKGPPGDAGPEPECVSPDRDPGRAYEPGAVGCACNDEPDVCVNAVDSAGRSLAVAFVCQSGHWMAVIDGPCMPGVDAGR